MNDFEPVPYRIRIGVTGHRNLADVGAVMAAVKASLDAEIDSLFSADSLKKIERVRQAGTTGILFSILTPLAEGADRAVARAVLEYPGARLDAVLPLAVEDYLLDFATAESKQEFHDLLALSRRPVRLRERLLRDERSGDPKELRRESYEQAGHYVVDHCDLLIAVWDGAPSRGRGGTAEIVQYALEQRRPVIRVWEGAFEMLNREDCHGLDASALGCIDQFNREHVPAEARQNRGEKLDRSLFVAPAAAADVPPAARGLVNRFLTPYYAQASIIAERNQKKFYRAGKSIYTYSALAVGCAAAGVLLESSAWWVPCLAFGVELVLLVVILLTLHHAHGARAHQRWIENRFLAERIRCSIFLAVCGVEPRPIEVLPYMGHSQTSNDWMVRVLDEIWDCIPPLAACNQQEPQQLNAYVREAWIEDQMTFHQGKQKREGKMRRRLSRAGQIVLPITLAAAIGHLLLPLWKTGSIEAGPFFEWMRRGLTFIALMFPAIAASLAGMEAHREYLRLEKRSANMVPQLQKLSHQMGSATDRMRFESLLQQLDEVMLRETQDWLMLMRFVEIKAG